MRLIDDDNNRPVNNVWVYVTVSEARNLLELLVEFFREEDDQDTDWHGHVTSADGRPKELTVALYDPDVPPKDVRWQKWFREDEWTPGMFGETPPSGA